MFNVVIDIVASNDVWSKVKQIPNSEKIFSAYKRTIVVDTQIFQVFLNTHYKRNSVFIPIKVF